MQLYISVIFILYLSNLVVGYLDFNDYKLEQLQILFRHGDRTPDKSMIFANDPYNKLYESYGYGQLTKIGKARVYKIGQILRNRYIDFLGEYRNDDVYAYSSDMDRTKMSLQLVLAGLYPPSALTSWSYSINWHPIPTHYETWDSSFLSAAFDCPIYQKLYNEHEKLLEISELFQKYQTFYQRIENNTGITMSKWSTASLVYSNLRCSLGSGLPLPPWCSKQDFQELEKITALNVKALTGTEQLRRMIAGPLVKQVLKVLNDNDNSKRLYLYSGHDINIAPFIHAHNITGTPDYPDFGSTIIIEKLRGADNRSYIRLYLWTGVTEEFISLKLDNCERTCPLSDYEKIVQPILPNDASRICTFSKALCRRRMDSAKKIDPDLKLSYFFAGSDLTSFKYMKDFSPYTIERS